MSICGGRIIDIENTLKCDERRTQTKNMETCQLGKGQNKGKG